MKGGIAAALIGVCGVCWLGIGMLDARGAGAHAALWGARMVALMACAGALWALWTASAVSWGDVGRLAIGVGLGFILTAMLSFFFMLIGWEMSEQETADDQGDPVSCTGSALF